MSVQALGGAILAAIPRNVVPKVYEGQVDETKVSPPWVVANLRLPQVRARSLGASVQNASAHLQLTIAAGTATGVLAIVDDLMGIDGARVDVEGWSVGPLLVHNVRNPEVDRSVTFAGAVGHVVFTTLEVRCTVSQIPTPVPAP